MALIFVQIPIINEHLFCKYFVRLSVGNATKGFATYGCFHPCLNIITAPKIIFSILYVYFINKADIIEKPLGHSKHYLVDILSKQISSFIDRQININ